MSAVKRLWAWLVLLSSWLTYREPEYQTVRAPSRDRSLRGKARIKARRSR